MSVWRNLLAALSFMTRLAPPPKREIKDFYKTLPLFPLVGLILGCVLAAPFYLGFFGHVPLVAAWLLAAANLWLTRGLHYDGFADLFDAWGSMARKDRFFEIMKDSRVGAFGALGLVFGALGQILLFSVLLERRDYGAIVWCFVYGRANSVVLMRLGRSLLRPGLGALFLPGATNAALALTLALTLVLGLALVPFSAILLTGLAALPVLVVLYGLAKRHEGMNGDFIGASIVAGELAACLGAVLS